MYIIKKALVFAGQKIINFSDRFERGPELDEGSDIRYAPGATVALDLIKFYRDHVIRIYEWDKRKQEIQYQEAIRAAKEAGIPVIHSRGPVPIRDAVCRKFCMSTEFQKWDDRLQPGNHVIMVEPRNIGNVGAVLRSAVAFGIQNVAVIRESNFDTFEPMLIRASMGTRIGLHVEYFETIEDYIARFPENHRYAFMLSREAVKLGELECEQPYSLIFGNESNGLPEEFAETCTPVFIEQSDKLDSLNVSVAASIAMYTLCQ